MSKLTDRTADNSLLLSGQSKIKTKKKVPPTYQGCGTTQHTHSEHTIFTQERPAFPLRVISNSR